MKAIIIDDEKQARISLSLLVEEYFPTLNIVAECENLPQGVKAIRKLKPDLVFLDIEMPGHSGLELLDFSMRMKSLSISFLQQPIMNMPSKLSNFQPSIIY